MADAENPAPLTKNTAVQLSIATLFGVAVAIVGASFWASEKLSALDDAGSRISALENKVENLEAQLQAKASADTVARLAADMSDASRSMDVSRCREQELRDILDNLVSAVDQLTVIIQTGGGEVANTRAMPILNSLHRRLEEWKCQ
jgi:molecular chaperone GrpE (heat shock protein)